MTTVISSKLLLSSRESSSFRRSPSNASSQNRAASSASRPQSGGGNKRLDSRLGRIMARNRDALNNIVSELNDSKAAQLPEKLNSSRSNDSGLIKKSNRSPPQSRDIEHRYNKQLINPSTTLLLQTAQDVNKFVDSFEKLQLTEKTEKKSKPTNKYRKRPISYTNYSGLKPLSLVDQSGPCIENCLGIIKEPKQANSLSLRKIYEEKLKLLEAKIEADRSNSNNQREYLTKNSSSNDLKSFIVD